MFPIEIVTAEGLLYQAEPRFIRVPGIDGEVGIQRGHAPFMTQLRPGEIIVRLPDDDDYLFVAGGFLMVTPEKVVILADVAERGEGIDVTRADAARRRAEQVLRETPLSAEAAKALERALLRLRIA